MGREDDEFGDGTPNFLDPAIPIVDISDVRFLNVTTNLEVS